MEKDISSTTNNFNPYQAVKFVPAFQGDDIEKCFQIFEKAALSTMWPELSWVLLLQSSSMKGKAPEALLFDLIVVHLLKLVPISIKWDWFWLSYL